MSGGIGIPPTAGWSSLARLPYSSVFAGRGDLSLFPRGLGFESLGHPDEPSLSSNSALSLFAAT